MLSALMLYLTPHLPLPVCLYTCVSPPKLLRPIPVDGHSGEQLLSGADFCLDASLKGKTRSLGTPPDPRDLVRVIEHAKECIEFSDVEVHEIKVRASPWCCYRSEVEIRLRGVQFLNLGSCD